MYKYHLPFHPSKCYYEFVVISIPGIVSGKESTLFIVTSFFREFISFQISGST